VYVTGSTSSSSFPSTANAAQPANAGATDDLSFLAPMPSSPYLRPTAPALFYSTYLGGTDFEEGDSFRLGRFGIAVDNFGDVYVVGQTTSFDFPLTTEPIRRIRSRE